MDDDDDRGPAAPVPADDPAQVFGEHRDLLVGVAYRVLGRGSDAEQVVQETWPAELTAVQPRRGEQ